jgi:hypothetical protein
LAIDLHYAAWILTVWLVKGKAVEDSQDARQEVLLPAYRVTGNPEVNFRFADYSAKNGYSLTTNMFLDREDRC